MAPREAQEASAELGRLVRQTWAVGWQPADLRRVFARGKDPVVTQVLGDLVAMEVAQHAPATVDDRWFAQLEEMSARVWWEPSNDPLTARAARARDGWEGVRRAVLLLGPSLRTLPSLERLGPLPGEATSRGGAEADLDLKLLAKVRMMLAKAESTPYEEEADAFTAAAQKLMARHSIDRAMLDEAERVTLRVGGPSAIRVGIDRPYEGAKFSLLASVAQANRCRAIWHQGLGFGTVVGFGVDLRAVELLQASLLVQATSAMRAQGSRTNRYGESRTRSFRRSFITGFAHRIGERLTTTTQEETLQAAGELECRAGAELGGTGPTGTELVRVLADREESVEDAVAERFPSLRSVRSRASIDPEGWNSGRVAAERAQLGVRGRLA
ncbi:DUF2786 domain-containing protein [Ornithinimicrobium pratense]|nr:DUF2786 domain-containing protein [Ornithinimicrobium pratense]